MHSLHYNTHTHTHTSGAIAYPNSYFGHHSLPSNTYFYCFGNESSLSSCQSSTTTCNFANTAGVYCKGDVISGKVVHKKINIFIFKLTN